MKITNEQRREIAAKIRESKTVSPLIDEFKEVFYAADDASLAGFVADLIDRPTCCNIGREEVTNSEGYDFYCTSCGFATDVPDANYCPYCGAEVIDG